MSRVKDAKIRVYTTEEAGSKSILIEDISKLSNLSDLANYGINNLNEISIIHFKSMDFAELEFDISNLDLNSFIAINNCKNLDKIVGTGEIRRLDVYECDVSNFKTPDITESLNITGCTGIDKLDFGRTKSLSISESNIANLHLPKDCVERDITISECEGLKDIIIDDEKNSLGLKIYDSNVDGFELHNVHMTILSECNGIENMVFGPGLDEVGISKSNVKNIKMPDVEVLCLSHCSGVSKENFDDSNIKKLFLVKHDIEENIDLKKIQDLIVFDRCKNFKNVEFRDDINIGLNNCDISEFNLPPNFRGELSYDYCYGNTERLDEYIKKYNELNIEGLIAEPEFEPELEEDELERE